MTGTIHLVTSTCEGNKVWIALFNHLVSTSRCRCYYPSWQLPQTTGRALAGRWGQVCLRLCPGRTGKSFGMPDWRWRLHRLAASVHKTKSTVCAAWQKKRNVAQYLVLAAVKRWIPPKRWRTLWACLSPLRQPSPLPMHRAARCPLFTPMPVNSIAICCCPITRTGSLLIPKLSRAHRRVC